MRTALRLLSQVPAYAAGQRGSKLTTGITGLPVHPNPLPVLLETYRSTLSSLQAHIPAGVVYRQSAEAITQHRISVVEKHAGKDGNQGGEQAIQAIERELNQGIVEELIKIAEDEQTLVPKMAEWKSYVPKLPAATFSWSSRARPPFTGLCYHRPGDVKTDVAG